MTNRTDQRGSSAGGDITGRDKTEFHFYGATVSIRALSELKTKLKHEIDAQAIIDHTIEQLACYYENHAPDGVRGLEAKLQKSGRADEINFALMQKERFVKLLDKFRHYASAQEIFLILLAQIHTSFELQVRPALKSGEIEKANLAVQEKIIIPILNEMDTEVFTMDHGLVMGMLYWLAEQCFVRWHS